MSGSKNIRKKRYSNIVKKVVGGETFQRALEEENYSKVVAKSPSLITTNKTFKELLDDILPEDFVMDQHRRLYHEHRNIKQLRLDTIDDTIINKVCEGYENVQVVKNEEEGTTTLIINEVDKEARKNAIEMAYKLRGSFSPIKLEVKRTYEDLTDKEILEMMKG